MQLYKVSIKVILMNVFVDLKQTLNVFLKVMNLKFKLGSPNTHDPGKILKMPTFGP